MLDEHDIEMIKSTRAEVTALRLKEVTLVREVTATVDAFTGNPGTREVTEPIFVTWTALTGSGTSGTDYDYVDGVQVMTGDILADADISYDLTGAKYLVRNGVKYVIRAIEVLGLGADNRYFILARRAS